MSHSKNSRRVSPSKNSRQPSGASEGVGIPEQPKNSRRVSPVKDGAEVSGAETPAAPVKPKNSRRPKGGIPAADVSPDSGTAPMTGRNGGQSPNPVGEVTPPERPNGRNRCSRPDKSGSGQPTLPYKDGTGRPGESDSPANIAELSAKVEALKRQRRASALRGALLVFLPPVVLCVPLFILKGCNLLLLSWSWCVSPLILWAFPIGGILSIFVRCVRLYRQQGRQDKATAVEDAGRG